MTTKSMSERPRVPDMFDEAMKAAKEGDMFDQAMKRTETAPTVDSDKDEKPPKELPADADMFEVAMQEAKHPTTELADEDLEEVDMFDEAMAESMKPEIELQDEDLEEVEGDMFDLAGAQVVDQKPQIKLKGPIAAGQERGDMFDQAMERARREVAEAAGTAKRAPKSPPPLPRKAEEPVMEVSDDDIISEEEIPGGESKKAA